MLDDNSPEYLEMVEDTFGVSSTRIRERLEQPELRWPRLDTLLGPSANNRDAKLKSIVAYLGSTGARRTCRRAVLRMGGPSHGGRVLRVPHLQPPTTAHHLRSSSDH